MLLERLPPDLEDAAALLERRGKAAEKKELWRSTYTEAFKYAMPTRETFTWSTQGANKQSQLYESTLMESTYTAANTLCALLFPAWTRWAELGPGGAFDPENIPPEVREGLQKATKTFFDFLNSSNFGTVINECALDLMIGTCSLSFDEGTADEPFIFTSIPLSAIEIEEGPRGSVETTWMLRKPILRNLLRMYDGLTEWDLSPKAQELFHTKPDETIEIIQGEVYHPDTKKYFGVVIEKESKTIIWRYDFGLSCPMIVARATKIAGETYGRGRVLLALPDAKTLDKMQEFVLRKAAIDLAPPMTGVSDGVLNPYTATLTPNTIIPVASNDSRNPSLSVLDMGGNFQLTETRMEQLRQNVRRIMQGPEPSEGAVKSATEIDISDRNRLWAMNGEMMRIQAELLAKIIARGTFILQKKGLMAKFKINGRQVLVKYTSPFSKTQNAEDVMALQEAVSIVSMLGPETMAATIKTDKIPAWVFRMKNLPETFIRDEAEQRQVVEQGAQVMNAATQQQAQAESGQAPAPPPQMGE